jgi:hypothetical protein
MQKLPLLYRKLKTVLQKNAWVYRLQIVWICTGYCNTLGKDPHKDRRKWHKLYFSLSRLIRVNKSNRLGWEWHVTWIQETRSPHKILIENAKGSTPLPSSRHIFVISLRFITQHICIYGRIILKWLFKKRGRGRGLDRSNTGWGQAAGCCEHGYETSSLIEGGKILD